jgi:acetyl-CoA synthetase
MSHDQIIWRPRPDDLERSRVAVFMRRHSLGDAAALRERAARRPDWFYPAILSDLGVEWFKPYRTLLDASRGLPWTQWFLGGRLNIVHNVLDRHLQGSRAAAAAVVAEDESGAVERLTYAELNQRVCRFAGALASLGVGAGDAVAFYLPMRVEVVVALLACLKIGAVPVPIFAGFGPDAVASRLADAGARVVLTADATVRRGKTIDLKGAADAACALAPDVRHLVVLRRGGAPVAWHDGRDRDWDDLEAQGPADHPTARLDSGARSLILYTSGTTGKPKGAVHTHAGVLVVTAKEVGYHLDVRAGDVMFWLTDIGWMMGPWEILGTLFHGGTVVLMEGAPDFPQTDRLWAAVERHRVTHLGVAPTAIRVLAAHGREPLARRDLSSLRMLGSTGEPWDEASYLWYFENVGGSRCPVINISGGTELMGCLLAPLAVAPLRACTLQGPALGMDVDVVDDRGASVRGEVGHLVCRNAAPNMTRSFLGDDARYLDTYFARFGESVWSHGDWACVDADGMWFLSGRSDDTLKIAGKRVGPAEIEEAAIAHGGVREAAAVAVPDPVKGDQIVLVAVASGGAEPGAPLAREVADHVAARLGSTMRPARVIWVEALPVTRSGKILRGIIRRILCGQDAGSLASVANADAVEGLRARSGGGTAARD